MRKRFAVVFSNDSEEDLEPDAVYASDEDADEIEEDLARAPSGRDSGGAPSRGPSRGKITLSLKAGRDGCRVCGSKDHRAGFSGATYIDCPNKPCYLCKKPGHTTATCPHRLAPLEGDSQAANLASGAQEGVVQILGKREREGGRVAFDVQEAKKWVPCAAVLKLHKRRCTALEFHPHRNNVVVSGDKSGQVAVWNTKDVFDTTMYADHHRANANAIRFIRDGDGMACLTTSADGFLKALDIETGQKDVLLNLNPKGWIEGVSNEKNWQMLYGLAVTGESLGVAGDSHGKVHFVDTRAESKAATLRMHDSKVTSCDVSPALPWLMLSSSNDHTAQLSDIRCLSDESKGSRHRLCSSPHPRVVTQACFSPVSGCKVLTTCIDNRLRVWDCVQDFGAAPTREIVHSHDFSRYLTPFRADWDPKDLRESTVAIGRYISEDFDGLALHPVDFIDVSTGQLRAELVDPSITTISPVNKIHPRLDLLVSGSSTNLYAWCPDHEEEQQGEGAEQAEAKTLPHGYAFYDANDSAAKKKRAKVGKTK